MASNVGRWSSVALAASGVGIALQPDQATKSLGLAIISPRGRAEVRAGLGGTFAALGTWALLRNSSDVYRAVGVTWLGAAAARLTSLRVDEPETNLTYWAFLVAELGFGLGGLVARGR